MARLILTPKPLVLPLTRLCQLHLALAYASRRGWWRRSRGRYECTMTRHRELRSLDRLPLWVWVGGVALFGGLTVGMLAFTGHASAAFIAAVGLLYAVGLGRAVTRRELLQQGTGEDLTSRSLGESNS